MAVDPGALAATLGHLERTLLNPQVRRDAHAVAALLTEDFLEFGSSGRVFSREAILAALAAEQNFTAPLLEDLRIIAATDDLAVISYRLSHPTHSLRTEGSLRSSTWVRRGNRWQMRFHQGTREAAAGGGP